MNLITALLALALETGFIDVGRYRKRDWFERYHGWLEARLGRLPYWDGPVGLLITLFIPLFLTGLAVYWAERVHLVFGFALSLLALLYSFGPAVNALLDRYIDALAANDEAQARGALKQLLTDPEEDETDQSAVIGAFMVRSHERLFAALFWFFVLGAVGALLSCLAVHLSSRHQGAQGGYAQATRDLRDLLMWPSARLLALGFALSGSLMGAFEGWRGVSGHSLETSREVIAATGLGALHYESGDERGKTNDVAWVNEAPALVNRTLILWLIVLGVMTLAGWIA